MATLPLTDEYIKVQLTLIEIDHQQQKTKILWDGVERDWEDLLEKADKELKKWYDRDVYRFGDGDVYPAVEIVIESKDDKKN